MPSTPELHSFLRKAGARLLWPGLPDVILSRQAHKPYPCNRGRASPQRCRLRNFNPSFVRQFGPSVARRWPRFSASINTGAVRKCIGLVFEDPSLDDQLTARENLVFHPVAHGVPTSERAERIGAAMRLVGLSERAGSRVRTFSGGMKRRLEIAAASSEWTASLPPSRRVKDGHASHRRGLKTIDKLRQQPRAAEGL